MAKSKKQKVAYKKARQNQKAQKVLRKKQRHMSKLKSALGKVLTMANRATVSQRTIRESGQYPVYACHISNTWEESGLAYIWLARKTSPYIVVAIYLVDLKCLGLKNTFVSAYTTEQAYRDYKVEVMERNAESFVFIDCTYRCANNIIYGGITYARQFGFEPHKDFQLTQYVLGSKLPMTEKIHFGDEDGKPFYISGPHDNVDAIMQQLTKAVGAKGFHYLVGFPGNE